MTRKGQKSHWLARPLAVMKKALVLLLVSLVQVYRYGISPLLPKNCRYEPSCSSYALTALRLHGPLKGGWLAFSRICRCHPWGGWGYDPVPEPTARSGEADKNSFSATRSSDQLAGLKTSNRNVCCGSHH